MLGIDLNIRVTRNHQLDFTIQREFNVIRDGALWEFITGAITQHYPKTLARQVGSDFRLATVAEMDELEAFMKSTGRRADLVLSGSGALSLKNEVGSLGS